MVKKLHRVIVAYDIASNRRRRRIRRVLTQWRIGGQKSVHECLLSYRDAQLLFVELCEVVNPMEDKLLLGFVHSVLRTPNDLSSNTFIYLETGHG